MINGLRILSKLREFRDKDNIASYLMGPHRQNLKAIEYALNQGMNFKAGSGVNFDTETASVKRTPFTDSFDTNGGPVLILGANLNGQGSPRFGGDADTGFEVVRNIGKEDEEVIWTATLQSNEFRHSVIVFDSVPKGSYTYSWRYLRTDPSGTAQVENLRFIYIELF